MLNVPPAACTRRFCHESQFQATERSRRARNHRDRGASAAQRAGWYACDLLRWRAAVCPGIALLLGGHEPQSLCVTACGGSRAGSGRFVSLDEILAGGVRAEAAGAIERRATSAAHLGASRANALHANGAATDRLVRAAAGVDPSAAFRLAVCVLPEPDRAGRHRRAHASRGPCPCVAACLALALAEPCHPRRDRLVWQLHFRWLVHHGNDVAGTDQRCFLESKPSFRAVARRC